MKLLRASTWLHKWVALVVGIQVLFWVAGGLVMTAIPIETVRSEHHIAEQTPVPIPVETVLPLAEAARRAGVVPVGAELRGTPRGPVWTLRPADGEPVTVMAADAAAPTDMTPDEARALAAAAYRGEAEATTARLLPEAPEETGRNGPLWRVDFADREGTSFYLSPATGEVVSRRSNVWRFYDFFWRLHILDLENGTDFNHPLLIIATVLTLSIVISGFILLFIRLSRDAKMALAKRRARTAAPPA